MPTLLLRLAGPMQSWGTSSKFNFRESNRDPSKSGVIGLCCAALGRSRTEDVSDLAKLRMGVRIDNEGIIHTDFQTAQGVIKADGKKSKDAVISTRYYLGDADFLVGLEGDDIDLLKKIHASLEKPQWQIYLGRKSYPPSKPIFLKDGLKPRQDLETALKQYPLGSRETEDNGNRRVLVIEVPITDADQIRFDQPLGRAFETRVFAERGIITKVVEVTSN